MRLANGGGVRVFILVCMVVVLGGISYGSFWEFPELLPPSQYGNILINRTSEKNGQQPVSFSHWSHRMRYTCRVCHFELDFAMKVNTTGITEEENRQGEFCGTCHNGDTAFGHTKENCPKCHNGNIAAGAKKFEKLKSFPKARFGNKINWTRAMRKKKINPKMTIFEEDYSPIPFKKTLKLKPEWSMANNAYAVFPHKPHSMWLDCANCHPDIFNIKKKSTKHFRMEYILEGKFCGVCHLNVALPIQDCKACHPGLKTIQ